MGKDEPVSITDTSTGTTEQKIKDTSTSQKPVEPEKKPEPERKIIKFDTAEKSTDQNKPETEQKKKTTENKAIPDVNKIVGDKTPGASADAAREDLEQRRTILQNLKDFDFLIKKNQEDIGNLTEKVESLTKDLDDLVSLYEIVSEQMNPFVGLSKVTKKRLDALENITKEVETIKNRVGDLESSHENGGGTLEGAMKKEMRVETITAPVNTATSETTIDQRVRTPIDSLHSSTERSVYQGLDVNLSEGELDEILSKSFEALRLEQNIDSMITDFFLTLK